MPIFDEITGRKIASRIFHHPVIGGGSGGGGGGWGITTQKIRFPEEALTSISELRNAVTKYCGHGNLLLIDKAFALVTRFHGMNKFPDGELVLMHELRLAKFLADWEMPVAVVAAGLVHQVPLNVIEETLGTEVKDLVKRKQALDRFTFRPRDGANQIMRCLFGMIRQESSLNVHLLAIADMLQTLLTSANMEQRLAKEDYAEKALSVTNELLKRLGYHDLAKLIEDQAFFYLNREKHREYNEKLKGLRPDLPALKSIDALVQDKLTNLNVPSSFKFDEKGVYQSFRKVEERGEPLSDPLRARYITDTENNCYKIAYVIIEAARKEGWEFMADLSKDHIAKAKKNKYQSIHLKFEKEGKLLEFQVRTEEMHKVAESGEAAHHDRPEKNPDIPPIKFESTSAAMRLKEMREKVVKDKAYYVIDDNGVIHEIITEGNESGSAPTVIDYAIAKLEDAGVHLARAYKLVRDDDGKTKWEDKSIDSEVENGDIIRVAMAKDAFPTEQNFFDARSPLAKIFIGIWLSSPDKSRKIINDTARGYILKGREILERTLNDHQELARIALLSQVPERDLDIKVLCSVHDLSGRMGLRSENHVYIKIAMSKDPFDEAFNIADKLKDSFITIGHGKGRKKPIVVYLLYKNRLGMFPQIAKYLKDNNINLHNLDLDQEPKERRSGEPFTLTRMMVSFETEASFRSFVQSIEHVYSDIKFDERQLHETPITIQIFLNKDKANEVGVAARIIEAVAKSGVHFESGNLGNLRLMHLKVRPLARKRLAAKQVIESELKKLEEAGDIAHANLL